MSANAFGSALHRAASLLATRLEALEPRVRAGDEAAWPEYRETALALATLEAKAAPEYLSTKALAERLGVAPKTLLRRAKRGQLTPAVRLGRLIRWKAPAVASGGNAHGKGAAK